MPSGCSLLRTASAAMPMPIRSSLLNRSTASCGVMAARFDFRVPLRSGWPHQLQGHGRLIQRFEKSFPRRQTEIRRVFQKKAQSPSFGFAPVKAHAAREVIERAFDGDAAGRGLRFGDFVEVSKAELCRGLEG